MQSKHYQETHELSAESISSTISHRTRASGDAAPYFFDASRAAWMASELSTRSDKVVAWRGIEFMLDGTKADPAEAVKRARMSFIFI